MNHSSWSEFFSMGGYALYVWGSYLVALLAIGGEVVFLLRRKKCLLQQMKSTSKGTNNETKA